MEHFEKFDKQLLSSYESTFAVEGREICEEVDSILEDNDELLVEKANSYCLFYTDPKRVNIHKNLFDKCKKFLDNLSNYRNIKSTLEHISRIRKTMQKIKILININI